MKTEPFDCFPKLRRAIQDGGIQVVNAVMENIIPSVFLQTTI